MSDFLSGISKAKTTLDVIEFCERAIPRALKLYADHKHTQEFMEAIHKQNPNAQTVNAENAAFYETTGLGSKEIQERLHKHNIPNIGVEMTEGGRTVIAVPKQFAAQANLILGQTAIINDAHQGNLGEQLPTEQQQFLKQISTHKDSVPSPVATRALTSGQVEAMELSPGAALGLQARLQRDGIASTAFTNTQTGKTTVCFDKIFTAQAQAAFRELERTPTELSRNDFMKKNLGESIVEKTGITEGQMRIMRAELMGSGLQYNAERQDNGTFTVRFPQKEAAVIAPAIIRATAITNGRNGPAVEAHAAHITETARSVADKAADAQPCYVADAQKPENHFTIDKTGMRDAAGKLVVGKQDPNFEAHVYAATMKMQAPIVKDGDKLAGKGVEDVFTREEIVAAKEGAALANPDQASVLAGQVACLAVQPDLAKPNADVAQVMNDAANVVKTMANGIEEEGYRLSPEELKDVAYIPGDRVPDSVTEFVHSVSGLTPDERTALSDAFNKTADSMSGCSTRTVGKHDASLEDIGHTLEAQERGEEYDITPRGNDTPTFGNDEEPVIGVEDV